MQANQNITLYINDKKELMGMTFFLNGRFVCAHDFRDGGERRMNKEMITVVVNHQQLQINPNYSKEHENTMKDCLKLDLAHTEVIRPVETESYADTVYTTIYIKHPIFSTLKY